MNEKSLDWAKPVQFENGESCELIGTYEKGYPLFPNCTRCVKRIGVTIAEASTWFFAEDGKSNHDGYNIINVRDKPPEGQKESRAR